MRALQLFVLVFCSIVVWGDTLVGAGSNLPGQVLADAQFAYRFVKPSVDLQFYGSESQAGICRLESFDQECDPSDTRAPPALDFAASTVILNQSDYADYSDIQMYPVLATAIVPVYNLRGVRNLILTRPAIAQIMSGQITTWDDFRITAYNANFSQWNIPPKQRIEIVVRGDSSDVTRVYKNAMYAFSSTFSKYVEMTGEPSWGSLNVTKRVGYEALNTYILTTPYTISYSLLQNAMNANLPRALIWKGTNIVLDASIKTTTFAVLELGLDFGNNGDDPSHLTADLNYARGVNGYPIVTYTYLVLRTATLRAGATCDTVRETVAFWQWFLTASVIQEIAEAHYFVQPPSVVRDIVVQRLVSDVTCLGRPVFRATPALQVTAVGEPTMAGVLQALAEVHAIDEPQMSLQYTTGPLNTSAAVAAALAAAQFVAVRQPALAPPSGTATLLFAGVAVAVVSQYNLVLDLPTLVRIMEGGITNWLHPDLMALNPAGFWDSTGSNITDATQRIVLLNGPTSNGGAFQSLMQRYAPGFVGRALQNATGVATEEQLLTVVAGRPFTLAVTTTVVGEPSARTKFARLQWSAGVPVAPGPTSILACAASGTYSAANGLDLTANSDATCYPLSDAVYLIVRTPECGNVSSVDTEGVSFLTWVFQDNSTASALQGDGVALLAAVSPAVKAANAQALSALTCSAPDSAAEGSSSGNIIPIVVGACVGALVVIGLPVAWYVRKSTRDMRALQKQVSDVKVAEDCAEAIACFDLEAVSWLATLSKPTKIQLAFRQIVSLLVEVKPFIPDQLMAQLQAKQEEDGPMSELQPARHPRKGSDDLTTSSRSMGSPESSFRSGKSIKLARHDSYKALDSKPNTVASSDGSGPARRGRGGRAAASNANPGADRFRRTCTYMFVRFVITGEPEADKLGQLATTVAAHVVTLGKAHGATIDKVTYDSVALHWNVSVLCSGAPLQATTLAMELACTAQILAPEVQRDLRLLVGIGHGPSTVATVSAAGQRFFVVGGAEIANAVDVVMREVAVPLGCTILLSNAVQGEVRYGFRCSPRLWFRDALFWEPMEGRGGCKVDDEWMYQIKHMELHDTALDVDRALRDVFLLARTGQANGVLQREIHHVQQTYGEHLAPPDFAALRLLQESAESCSPLAVSPV